MQMTTSEFLTQLGETLMADEPLTPETELRQLSGWDSMNMLAVLSLIDESLGASLPRGSIQKCVLVSDILALVKDHLSG
jgi:acyl carrier protein